MATPPESEYDDNYATCVETFVWLRVMGEGCEPSAVSDLLLIEPTRVQHVGMPIREGASTLAKASGWFLESKGHVDSKDSRRHLDWLLDQLTSRQSAIKELQDRGMKLDICCYWLSVGQGGPTLSPRQAGTLSQLGIELWHDIYFDQE